MPYNIEQDVLVIYKLKIQSNNELSDAISSTCIRFSNRFYQTPYN